MVMVVGNSERRAIAEVPRLVFSDPSTRARTSAS